MGQVTFSNATDTTMPVAVMAIFAIVAILILVLPRKYVIVPALLTVFLIPQGDVLVMSQVGHPVAEPMNALEHQERWRGHLLWGDQSS